MLLGDPWLGGRYAVNPQDHIVFVVDDDGRIRDALSDLLSSYDLRVVTFGSAAEYIAYPRPDLPACLILDLELPDINGLDLQSQVTHGNHLAIVLITGRGDIPSSVRAIKPGAMDRSSDVVGVDDARATAELLVSEVFVVWA